MKNFFSRSIFFLSVFFLTIVSHAQTLDSTLIKYGNNYQAEKAYLHYDKSSYSAGETIWFKVYLMQGLFPANDSKTFYVDWIADNGTVLSHTVSPLIDGATAGQFDIPADFTGNVIHVRGYTKWMLNFDTAFLYSKDIHILPKNTQAKQTRPAAINTLTFFPEGGEAVAEINNKIAFKANDQWGNPIKVRGVIVNSKGAVIDSFHSVHDGMGFVIFTPQEGINYSARWKDEKGAEHATPLPSIKSSGVTMQVNITNDKRYVTINCTNSVTDNLRQLHLVGTINQKLAFNTPVLLKNNTAQRIIPTGGLPSGILTLTLFDANWNAIAERITFINNHDFSFQPQMEVTHWGLSKRKRNDLQITLPDSLQSANLSISVTDAAIEKDTSDNIISHFLLTSDVRGKVNNPAYYFSNDNDSTIQYLDLVMLTNGWRRFKWEDIAQGKLPAITYPKDTSYLTLSGQLFGVSKSELSGKESMVLFVKGKDSSAPKVLIVPIQTNGRFGDPDIIPFDTLRVYYSVKARLFGNAEAKFMTDRLPAPNYSAFSKNFFAYAALVDTTGSAYHNFLAAEMLRLQQVQKGKVLETVTVTAKAKSPMQMLDEKYTSGLFQGGDSYQFNLLSDPSSIGYPNALSYLQGKVAGLQVTMTSPPTLTWRGGSPTLYLDEIQTDADMISSIPVSDIAYIKVFRPPFFGASGGGSNGAIAIYTRKGGDVQSNPSKGLSNNIVAGYTPIKQFYSPNYDTYNPKNEQPDQRTTLYWNPVIITTPKKPLTVTFYNNDVTKSFRVVIEGMTKDGLLTHYEQIME